MSHDIYTYLANMPTTIRAFTKENPDGSYTIMLNAKFNNEIRIQALKHEIDHIYNNDYEKTEDVSLIEFEAHGLDEKPISLKEKYPAAYAYMQRLKRERKKVKKEMAEYEQFRKEKEEFLRICEDENLNVIGQR